MAEAAWAALHAFAGLPAVHTCSQWRRTWITPTVVCEPESRKRRADSTSPDRSDAEQNSSRLHHSASCRRAQAAAVGQAAAAAVAAAAAQVGAACSDAARS